MSKTLSITLPPDMLERAELLARKESRTMSELVREALRQYERTRWWEDTNEYGQARAKAVGLREQDATKMVKEVRKARSAAKRPGRTRG